jgi:RHS repeat-associated protein
MGNRVEKTENNDAGVWSNTEYYVRDAQGNVMAIYKKYIRNNQLFYDLTEQHIYGSSRLGVDRRGVDVIAASSVTDNVSRSIKRGEKHYELSNHLGNVLATVSDKKIAVMSGANLSYYRADVVSYSDYYPFGAPMTERTALVIPTDVRYGFNGMERIAEQEGNYITHFRSYSSNLCRWTSIDPELKAYVNPYNSFSNSPLIKVDPRGDDDYFDESGNLVYSTGYGTTIRIITDANLKKINHSDISKKMVELAYLRRSDECEFQKACTEYLNSKISTVTLDKYAVNTDNNWSGSGRANGMVKAITNYYNFLLCQEDFVAVGIRREYPTDQSMMATSKDGVAVGFSEFEGRISYKGLVDINNYKNTLVHEYVHWKIHCKQGIRTELPNEISAKEHLKAYKAQIKHSTWSDTTTDFKDQIAKNIGTYLSLIKSESSTRQKFEKLLGVKYNVLSSDPKKVEYEKK